MTGEATLAVVVGRRGGELPEDLVCFGTVPVPFIERQEGLVAQDPDTSGIEVHDLLLERLNHGDGQRIRIEGVEGPSQRSITSSRRRLRMPEASTASLWPVFRPDSTL